MVGRLLSRIYFGTCKLSFRAANRNSAVPCHGLLESSSKQFLYESWAVSSAFSSPIGAVRTKKKGKPLNFPVDKRLPFKYTFRQMPTALTHPGDQDKTLGYIDKTQYRRYFENSEELKTADDNVKKLFTLEFGTKKDILDRKFAEVYAKIQRHPLDFKSDEAMIAKMTVDIRHKFEKLNAYPGDKITRAKLNTIVAIRNKLLKLLQQKDEERYNYVVKALEIDYQRPPLGVITLKPTRKLEIARLTDEYCQKIQMEKLDAFKEKLKAEQIAFLKEKEKMLEIIANEEKAIEENHKQLKEEEELFWKKKDYRNV